MFDCHGGLPKNAPHNKKQEPQKPYSSPTSIYVLERFSQQHNHHLFPPWFKFAMRATLPSRFALALDARAPRRSLNGASAAPGPLAQPTVPVTSAPTASSASVTSSGPIGQALLEKVGIEGEDVFYPCL